MYLTELLQVAEVKRQVSEENDVVLLTPEVLSWCDVPMTVPRGEWEQVFIKYRAKEPDIEPVLTILREGKQRDFIRYFGGLDAVQSRYQELRLKLTAEEHPEQPEQPEPLKQTEQLEQTGEETILLSLASVRAESPATPVVPGFDEPGPQGNPALDFVVPSIVGSTGPGRQSPSMQDLLNAVSAGDIGESPEGGGAPGAPSNNAPPPVPPTGDIAATASTSDGVDDGFNLVPPNETFEFKPQVECDTGESSGTSVGDVRIDELAPPTANSDIWPGAGSGDDLPLGPPTGFNNMGMADEAVPMAPSVNGDMFSTPAIGAPDSGASIQVDQPRHDDYSVNGKPLGVDGQGADAPAMLVSDELANQPVVPAVQPVPPAGDDGFGEIGTGDEEVTGGEEVANGDNNNAVEVPAQIEVHEQSEIPEQPEVPEVPEQSEITERREPSVEEVEAYIAQENLDMGHTPDYIGRNEKSSACTVLFSEMMEDFIATFNQVPLETVLVENGTDFWDLMGTLEGYGVEPLPPAEEYNERDFIPLFYRSYARAISLVVAGDTENALAIARIFSNLIYEKE